MRYRILDKEEVWTKIHEGRAIYCIDLECAKIYNAENLKVHTINNFLLDNKAIFIEDIAPDYDNEDGE